MAKEYVVKSGDTLSAIARDNKTDVNTLTQINSIQDPNKISVGQRIVLPGGDYAGAVSNARKQLETGTPWGTAWWAVKNEVPEADNAQIDKDLNKEFWAQPGAYEKFSADKGQPFSLDLDLDTGVRTSTPSVILPEPKKEEPEVKIVEPTGEQGKVEVIEPPKPGEVEIVEPDFPEPEVTFVTPEGRPYTPRKRPEDIPETDIGRSFFGGITDAYEDKFRKFGDKLNEMYKPGNEDIFVEVRDSVAKDVSNFFGPVAEMFIPNYRIIEKGLSGFADIGKKGEFILGATDSKGEEDERTEQARVMKQQINALIKETDAANRIIDVTKKWIVEKDTLGGALDLFGLYIDQKRYKEQKITPILEEVKDKNEPWQIERTKAQKDMQEAGELFANEAKGLEELGLHITYNDEGIPVLDEIGITKELNRLKDEINAKFDIKEDDILYTNNENIIKKYNGLQKRLEILSRAHEALTNMDITASSKDIAFEIQRQFEQLNTYIDLIVNTDASIGTLNDYRSTYEEAEKTQEQIGKEMLEMQASYDALLDQDMIDYIESTQRVDTMNQIEYQTFQNYGIMNRERINKLNAISQKWHDAKTRLEINALQAEKVADRYEDLQSSVNSASDNLMKLTATEGFTDNLTKFNILSADQSNELVKALREYSEADEWLKRNEKAVTDATIKRGDNFILAQAELQELNDELNNVMNKVVKASKSYADAWKKKNETEKYKEISDLEHEAAVATAVEKKRFLFGVFPTFNYDDVFNKKGFLKNVKTNKEIMVEAFGTDYTWADTQEVYWGYLKSRLGSLLGTALTGLGKAYNVVAYPGYEISKKINEKTFQWNMPDKPSEHAVQVIAGTYNWWYGSALPGMITTAATFSDDLDWVGLPTDTVAGHELRNIGLPEDYKKGIDSVAPGTDPGYKGTRGMRALFRWLNVPGPEDKQLLWTQYDKREVTADINGELEMFIDPWDVGNEKRIEQIKKLNPHIKDFENIKAGTEILLYKGSEYATEFMRKQDALMNFITGKASEERFVSERDINIFKFVPSGEKHAETVGAILDLNNFEMRGIDPRNVPAGEVIRLPKVVEMPELSNLIEPEQRLQLKTSHPILYQLREEAFNFFLDPIDLLWYPAGKAIKPFTKAIGLKAYGKLATAAEKQAFARGIKGSIDFAYSVGRTIKGTGPLPEHARLPRPEKLKGVKDLVPWTRNNKIAEGKLSLTDLYTKLDIEGKNQASLATLSALMTKFRGISLSKVFPYEIGKQMGMTDKALNKLMTDNEVLFTDAITKVSQETGLKGTKVKTYIHEYIADPTAAGPAENIFWKFNEHMGLSEGRLSDMMHKFPESYYDNVVTTKVSSMKDLVAKEMRDNKEFINEMIELNNLRTLGIDPEKIPVGARIITSKSNFFKELEKEIFRGKNVSKFELLFLTNHISQLDSLGRQALVDFFQYWDPATKTGRPIYNATELAERIAYWRKKYAKDAPEQKSIDKAIEIADFYRARTEHWAKMIEQKYAVPLRLSDDMEIYAITTDKFNKLTPEERAAWDKNGALYFTDPDTGKMKVMVVHDTKNGLGGDFLNIITTLKANKLNNTKKMVVGTMENQWKKTIPKNHEIIESVNSKTGEREYRYVYHSSGKKTATGKDAKEELIVVYTSLNNSTKGYVVSEVTKNDLLHTAYLGKRIGPGKKDGWYHTLSRNEQGELSSILGKIFTESGSKRIRPKYSSKKDWDELMTSTEYNPYSVNKGDMIDYATERPDIDLVLTLATSIEDLYKSNEHIYKALKGTLSIVKSNVEKGSVAYKMSPIDQLTYFLMELQEGRPNFFSRKEHQIIELILNGSDLTDVNINHLLRSQEDLGKAWALSKQKRVMSNREKHLGGEAAIAEKAMKTVFRSKQSYKQSAFDTLKDQLRLVPGLIAVKSGGTAAIANVGVFSNAEVAKMFEKYGDASYMLANPRLNREFSHLFSEKVPVELLPDKYTPLTEEITLKSLKTMSEISKREGGTKASIPLMIKDTVDTAQNSRTYLSLEDGDIVKKQDGKLVKAKSEAELLKPGDKELFLELPQADIGQKALDKLNEFEKDAAQAKVDSIFAKDKLNIAREKNRSVITINKLQDVYNSKLEIYEALKKEGEDYVATLGDDSIKFVDRSIGKTVDPKKHQATEFVITPELEKKLELVKIPKLDDGSPNPYYGKQYILPLDSEPHRVLYEYLRKRDDFTENKHFKKDIGKMKDKMTSEEVIELLQGEELQSLVYIFTKHYYSKSGQIYGLPPDQIVQLIMDSIDPEKFANNGFDVNAQAFKDTLAKIDLKRVKVWDAEKKAYVNPKGEPTRITALEAAQGAIEVDETELMTTIGYTEKEIAQNLEEVSGGAKVSKHQVESQYSAENRSGKMDMTIADIDELAVGDKLALEKLVNDITDIDKHLGSVLNDWNTALYTLKKELGIADIRPVANFGKNPPPIGKKLWDVTAPPTGKIRSNIERRMIGKTNGGVVNPEMLTPEVRTELAEKKLVKEKAKAKELDYEPKQFANDIGNVFDVQARMGPEDMGKWINDKTKEVDVGSRIQPLQNEIDDLTNQYAQIDVDVDRTIAAAKAKIDSDTRRLADAKKTKTDTEDLRALIVERNKAIEKTVKNIEEGADKLRKQIIDELNDKTNEIALITQTSDNSVVHHLLRTDVPSGNLFDPSDKVAGRFVESTYSDIESQIVKKREQIRDIKKGISDPKVPEADVPSKPIKDGTGYIGGAESKAKQFTRSERLLQLANANRELRSLESFRRMVIPWNLAKSNGIIFTRDELYWAGKDIIIDSMADKMNKLTRLMEKRGDLLNKPDGLKAIGIPDVTHPSKFAPSIDEKDIRKVFYDKLPGISSAKQVTIFKTDILEVDDLTAKGSAEAVIDRLQKLIDDSVDEKNLPFIYDMSNQLELIIKKEGQRVRNKYHVTKDAIDKAELLKRSKQINLIEKKLTIVADPDFFVDNLKRINRGNGMSASIPEYNAIVKSINKMKERGSVWLFGDRTAAVTPSDLKDSIYGKGMTQKSRDYLRVMRDDYNTLARQTREPIPGLPYNFPKDPDAITTRILGELDNTRWTPESLEKSIEAISETAWKGAARNNFESKVVKYDVGASYVGEYNNAIKNKNVLVRSSRGTILSTETKKAIVNGIKNDVTFFFPTVRKEGEESILQFAQQFPKAKIKYIDAREANITKMVFDMPIGGTVIDYLLINESIQPTNAMKGLVKAWSEGSTNRIFKSPDKIKTDIRGEINRDLGLYMGDPNKFPPSFITQKAIRTKLSKNPFGIARKSVQDLVVDWKSIQGRKEIKASWDKSMSDNMKIYRKELLENLKKKYEGEKVPDWHKELVEKQVASVKLSTERVGDHVFKFDMPMRRWERWYRNVSDKLFFTTELAALQNGKNNELNFPAGSLYDLNTNNRLMYKTAEWMMRNLPIAPQILQSIGRSLMTVWTWAILVLQPGWSIWNSISDATRHVIGTRNIVAFVDMQRMLVEAGGHLIGKYFRNLTSIPGDILDINLIARTNLRTKSGRQVAAQFDRASNTIYIDKNEVRRTFEAKAWTDPKVPGVPSYTKDAFRTIQEWENFLIRHERLHKTIKREKGETAGSYERRINEEAYETRNVSRFEVYDLTRIAHAKRTKWNPLSDQKFRDAWLAREKIIKNKAGEYMDIDDWEDITSSGLVQNTADPFKAAEQVKAMSEATKWSRAVKRVKVFKADTEIFVAQLEEARRQIMAFNLIYEKSFNKAKANALVKKWLYDYRDLTEAGQLFRKFFPFYTFNAKSIQLYLGLVKTIGPGVYNAANGLLDAWQDATYDLPDQYKERIKIGSKIYWLTRFGIQEYLELLLDPWNSLKEMVDNPLKVAFNFGWGPFSSRMIESYLNRGYWEVGPLMRNFEETGWTQEEIDRFKNRDDARMYDGVSFKKDTNSLMTWLVAYVPPTQLIADLFKMDVGFTLRGGSLLNSKKARSLMKYFTGINLLKLNEEEGSLDRLAYVFDRLRKLPPHKHYFFKKSLQNTDPEVYEYFRQYQILSKIKKIMEAKDGRSKDEKVAELHESLTIDTYYEKEFNKNGAGDAWLAQNPELAKIVQKHFDEITAKYGLSSGAVIGKKKYELGQVDASLRKMFEQVKTISDESFRKMELAGIENPFKGEFDKQELKDALYNPDGTRKFKTIDEAIAIVDQYDALIDLLEYEDYHAEAEKSYTDWQLLADAAKDAKKDEDAKFYRRMGMIFSIIPEGIDKMPDEQAKVYWDKWRMMKETLIDSVPEYKERYEAEMPAWQRELQAKNTEYSARWDKVINGKEEDGNYYAKFYEQPAWFQKWYFAKHPGKALYYPTVYDYTLRIGEIVDHQEKTGEWDSEKYLEALDFLLGKPNTLKAWDKAKPGVYNYTNKQREITAARIDDDTADYFDLFYQQPNDKGWNDYREYYFKKPENEYKKTTYPFLRKWSNLRKRDEANDGKTSLATDWFWLPKNEEARELYGEHNPLEDGKTKLDYQIKWKEYSPQIKEDRGVMYGLVLDSPSWFKNEYWRNHPEREVYYPHALKMQDMEFMESKEYFFAPENKEMREAWETDKPGTIANNQFWYDMGTIKEKDGRLASLKFYFDPKNAEQIAKHEANNPGANYAYRLWQMYEQLPKESWLGRKKRREFLRENPELKAWWGRNRETTDEEKEVILKEEIYYTILDRVSAEGKGRQYYLDYYKAKAEAEQYLKDNPDLVRAREARFVAEDEPADKTTRDLVDEYFKLYLQEDKTEFLEKHPEVDAYLQNLVPPGMKEIRKTQSEYFDIEYDDGKKQFEERQKFLSDHPELVEYWDVKNLPTSYWTDKAKFEKFQTQYNKATDYFDAVKKGDWEIAEKMKGKLPDNLPDLRVDGGRWLMNKLYRDAMATWATTFGSYMSTYYFRSLPSWLRNEYYRRNPDAKIISYTPMSRSLNNAVTIENSKHPDLAWARQQMRKYGKDLPSSISKQVARIMTKWGEWEERSTWSSSQWNEWWAARTARLNGLRAHDLQYIPLLRKELARANKMFSYSMLPISGGRKYGIINPFLGSPVLLPELTVGLENDIINNN